MMEYLKWTWNNRWIPLWDILHSANNGSPQIFIRILISRIPSCFYIIELPYAGELVQGWNLQMYWIILEAMETLLPPSPFFPLTEPSHQYCRPRTCPQVCNRFTRQNSFSQEAPYIYQAFLSIPERRTDECMRGPVFISVALLHPSVDPPTPFPFFLLCRWPVPPIISSPPTCIDIYLFIYFFLTVEKHFIFNSPPEGGFGPHL